MANVTNFHTCSTGCMHLILAAILVMDGHLLKFTGDVVGRATVCIPVGVHPMPSGSCAGGLVLVLIVVVVAVPAIRCFMTAFLADLTDRLSWNALLGTAIVVCTTTATIIATTIAASTATVVPATT